MRCPDHAGRHIDWKTVKCTRQARHRHDTEPTLKDEHNNTTTRTLSYWLPHTAIALHKQWYRHQHTGKAGRGMKGCPFYGLARIKRLELGYNISVLRHALYEFHSKEMERIEICSKLVKTLFKTFRVWQKAGNKLKFCALTWYKYC